MKKNVPIYVQILRMLALLCALIFFFKASIAQSVKFGNSYLNLSKKTIGGTVQPGDTLFRFTHDRSGNNISSKRSPFYIPVEVIVIHNTYVLRKNGDIRAS